MQNHCAGSAIKAKYMEWARGAIAELLRHGAIDTWASHVQAGRGVGNRPHLVMPLLPEPKPGKLGKFRLIHDCRLLSGSMEKWPFCMGNLRGFSKQTRCLGRLFAIDIASAYHHVEIALPGFHFEGVDCV